MPPKKRAKKEGGKKGGKGEKKKADPMREAILKELKEKKSDQRTAIEKAQQSLYIQMIYAFGFIFIVCGLTILICAFMPSWRVSDMKKYDAALPKGIMDNIQSMLGDLLSIVIDDISKDLTTFNFGTTNVTRYGLLHLQYDGGNNTSLYNSIEVGYQNLVSAFKADADNIVINPACDTFCCTSLSYRADTMSQLGSLGTFTIVPTVCYSTIVLLLGFGAFIFPNKIISTTYPMFIFSVFEMFILLLYATGTQRALKGIYLRENYPVARLGKCWLASFVCTILLVFCYLGLLGFKIFEGHLKWRAKQKEMRERYARENLTLDPALNIGSGSILGSESGEL